jgi:hypothetical protein
MAKGKMSEEAVDYKLVKLLEKLRKRNKLNHKKAAALIRKELSMIEKEWDILAKDNIKNNPYRLEA